MNALRSSLWIAGLVPALTIAAAPESEKPRELAPEASIPFVHHGSIRDWQADARKGVWIQDQRRQWYYASFNAPCHGLDFALTIGFDAGTMGILDRFGYIVVPDNDRCPIKSLVRSENPPPAKKKKDQAKPTAAS
jgi:Family of unknown function (DUF6491)